MPRDPLARRERSLERRARRMASAVDPAIEVYRADGELFEGPVISLEYPDDATTALPPLEVQELHLQRIAARLTEAGLMVQYVGKEEGIRKPFVEVCCDEEHHRRFMVTLATAQYKDDGTGITDPRAVAEAIGRLLFPDQDKERGRPMEESLDTQLAAGAREGLEYLRIALRTGEYKPELLQTARFLVEVKLAHDHRHSEEYTFSTDEDEELHGED